MRKKPNQPPPPTAPCAVCGGAMKHTRSIPAAGFMPEMFSFSCTVCGCPRTEEKPALSMGAERVQVAA